MGKKSRLSPEQHREIVLLMLGKAESITALARRYGVSETTLHRWPEDVLTAGVTAVAYNLLRVFRWALVGTELESATPGRKTAGTSTVLQAGILMPSAESFISRAREPNVPDLGISMSKSVSSR